MVEYTVILLYEWSLYGNDIKKMFHNNKLEWNSTKIKKLTNEELKNEYIKFKVNNDFKIDEYMIGSSGIYENKKLAIKIIKAEYIDDKIADNMLIVYKGIEEKFYIDLIKKCRDIGCLVLKIVNDEVVFKNRINVKLINKLNDIQGENDVKIKNFIEKTNIIGTFSDDFKNKWIELIKHID